MLAVIDVPFYVCESEYIAFSVCVLKSLSLSFPQNLTKCTVSRVITVCVFQGLIAIVLQKEVSQQRFLVHNTQSGANYLSLIVGFWLIIVAVFL